MTRENFKKLPIMKTLSQSLLQLNSTSLDKKEFYKIRTNVFEIIATLWLDDFHDNYLIMLEEVSINIKNMNFPSNEINKVFKNYEKYLFSFFYFFQGVYYQIF